MTGRSKKNVFPSFARGAGGVPRIAEIPGNGCRFCPDWATSEATPGAACDAARTDEDARDAEEFSVALERYRLVHRRRFVSCEEAVAVFKSLGYRKPPK